MPLKMNEFLPEFLRASILLHRRWVGFGSMNALGLLFGVRRSGKAFALILSGVLFFAQEAGANFFQYAFEFKNGTRVLYLTETTQGYVPGIFIRTEGEDHAHPLESSQGGGEGRGGVWFLESNEVPDEFATERPGATLPELNLNFTPKSELTFIGIDHRILAVDQNQRFALLADFTAVLNQNPGASFQFTTAPQTLVEGGQSYRAFEIRFYVPKADGKDLLVIRRGLIDQDFKIVEFPEVRVPLPGLARQSPRLNLGKTWGERGKILTMDHLGLHEGKISPTRSQIYFDEIGKGGNGISDFPLASWSQAVELPKTQHFMPQHAHESFYEFEERVYAADGVPKARYSELLQNLESLKESAKNGVPSEAHLKGREEWMTALSYFSYHPTVHFLFEHPRSELRPLPVLLYSPPQGEVSEAQLDRYFHSIDEVRAFVKMQPVYLVVPDRVRGEFRVHVADASNLPHFIELLKPDFNLCSFLATK
jgi:hypothetical protein